MTNRLPKAYTKMEIIEAMPSTQEPYWREVAVQLIHVIVSSCPNPMTAQEWLEQVDSNLKTKEDHQRYSTLVATLVRLSA
jgi:hypothetical protein